MLGQDFVVSRLPIQLLREQVCNFWDEAIEGWFESTLIG